jgi:transposase
MEQRAMSSIPVFVGLDYHDGEVQVCVLDQEGKALWNRGVPNEAPRIAAAVSRHGSVASAGIEACCGAAHLADELATRHQWPIHLAHPGYVARMKRGPDKHDLGDARLLADLVRVGYLPKVWLAPETTRQLRRLVRHRRQLVDQRRDVKLRLRALLRENRHRAPACVNAWTKRWVAWLNTLPWSEDDGWLVKQHQADLASLSERIREVEQRLTTRTGDDPLVQRLLTMEGVGLVTAVTLRAELGRLDRFRTGKELARFCGVTPRNASSGQRQADAGLVRAGNPDLRHTLIELAHRLVWRSESPWSKLGAHLLRQGKPKNVMVAAVANRWVRWLYHQLKSVPAGGDDLSSGSTEGVRPCPPLPSLDPRQAV